MIEASTSPARGYPASMRIMHWLIAAIVLFTIPLGLFMANAPQGTIEQSRMDRLYDLHKSLGVLIFALMALRLAVRWRVGAPAPVPTLTRLERIASSAVHHLLYLLLLLMPIGGWAANSAFGAPTPFFGLFNLPPLLSRNEALADRLFAGHRLVGIVLAVLILAHVGAALMHFVVRRDRVLQRMIIGR